MRHLNIIGPAVIKLRFERRWSQEVLATKLQCQANDFTRDVLANIETGRTQVTDKHIRAFQMVFGVCIATLFPKSMQELDEKLSSREARPPTKNTTQRRHYYRH
jgi:ribosome-binding protein aMBF1 (putative translation factor)